MNLLLSSLLLSVSHFSSSAHARVHHSSAPEDLYAFPKYRISFLNGLPLLNQTAEQWLRDGIPGGELEFLGQRWNEVQRRNPESIRKEIGDGQDENDDDSSPPPLQASAVAGDPFRLQLMRLGPQKSYLCFIPAPPEIPPISFDDSSNAPIAPTKSWSLLQPLTGSCLYHRQGWFTYAYCHNQHVRQFRELPHSHPHPPAGRIPEEDPEWEAYTLGRSPPALNQGNDVAVTDDVAVANGVELARGGGQRYLVQRWGEGTICDKTGRKREIEVQFHCSMTTTDTILFVKETRTCVYTLVIHTPRLCSEPGFKSARDDVKEAPIRCREVVNTLEGADHTLPESPYPLQRRPERAPNPPPFVIERRPKSDLKTNKERAELLKAAINTLFGKDSKYGADVRLNEEDGEVYLDVEMPAEGTQGKGKTPGAVEKEASLLDILRAAGYEVATYRVNDDGEEDGDEGVDYDAEELPSHDEL